MCIVWFFFLFFEEKKYFFNNFILDEEVFGVLISFFVFNNYYVFVYGISNVYKIYRFILERGLILRFFLF